MSERIGIIDCGAANRTSVRFALERVGARARIVQCASEIASCTRVILPGVANVGFVLAGLDAAGMREPLLAAIDRGVPLLGICAGFQALCDGSDEAAEARGLGVFRGRVRALQGLKRQHVGWSAVRATNDAPFTSGWAYFTHGYALEAGAPDAIAFGDYGRPFASAARRGSVLGVQFHPERSGAYGEAILRAFVGERERAYAG